MVVLDALGRRGALRILWELRGDPLTFRALQVACDTNPGSLNTRIKELRALGIIAHSGDGGYFLTDSGRGLAAALGGLQAWADDWAADIRQV
jgi:DNA-binding HxlR family transcriptional regulator